MVNVSVCIIASNEERIIGKTIKSLEGLTDDVLIGLNNSTDKTKGICENLNVKIIPIEWQGFGKTRNDLASFAKHNWILCIDADECVSDEIKLSIEQIVNDNKINTTCYAKFKSFYGNKPVYFGEWKKLKSFRLYNKTFTKWNTDKVHEKLELPANSNIQILKGFLYHYTIEDIKQLNLKIHKYGVMMGEKYFNKNKSANIFKIYFYPFLVFIKNYFFKLGFLDGREGFVLAIIYSYYSFLKYNYLYDLKLERKKN